MGFLDTNWRRGLRKPDSYVQRRRKSRQRELRIVQRNCNNRSVNDGCEWPTSRQRFPDARPARFTRRNIFLRSRHICLRRSSPLRNSESGQRSAFRCPRLPFPGLDRALRRRRYIAEAGSPCCETWRTAGRGALGASQGNHRRRPSRHRTREKHTDPRTNHFRPLQCARWRTVPDSPTGWCRSPLSASVTRLRLPGW